MSLSIRFTVLSRNPSPTGDSEVIKRDNESIIGATFRFELRLNDSDWIVLKPIISLGETKAIPVLNLYRDLELISRHDSGELVLNSTITLVNLQSLVSKTELLSHLKPMINSGFGDILDM